MVTKYSGWSLTEAAFSAPQNAGKSLLNMLRSHTAAYKALKAMPGAENVAIGIVHNVFWLEPKGKGPLYFHVRCELTKTSVPSQAWQFYTPVVARPDPDPDPNSNPD